MTDEHHDGVCDDPDCGCVAHRVKRVTGRWNGFVHRVVHPVSGAIVLTGAVVEVWEWVVGGAERLVEAAERLLHSGMH